jgi:hypothetical protein
VALIGRDGVRSVLRRAADDARAGHGRLMLLAGEPGIGKTTLAADVADYAADSGALIAWGACVAGAGFPDDWPWPEVLRALDGPTATNPAASDSTAPDVAWFGIANTVTRALRAAAQRSLVVVVLDDLQWAGAGSARVLDFATRQLRRAAVLFVGTYRDVEVDAGHPATSLFGNADVMRLGGLGVADVESLLRDAGADPTADADTALAVHRRTAGNPFFVLQIARLMAGEATGGVTATRAAAEMAASVATPAAVEDIVSRRMARLPSETVALLDVVAVATSVAGGDVDAALVAMAADVSHPTALARLEPAVPAHVLRIAATGSMRFAHDLFRVSRYDAMAATARARTHLALATALEARAASGGDRATDEIAQHYALAVPAVGADEAARRVEAAARDAAARLSYDDAVRHWQQAVRLGELAGGVASTVRLGLAEALLRAGRPRAARDAFLAAAERDGERIEVLATVALGVHRAGVLSGDPRDDVIALLAKADERLPPGGAIGARVRAALARELADGPTRDLARAESLATAAVRDAEAARDPAALATSLFAQHDVAWAPGTAPQRLALADRMLTAAEAGGEAALACEAALLRFVALAELADPRAAGALADVEARAERLREPHLMYLAMSRRATWTALTGSLDAAERQIAAAGDLADGIGEPDAFAVRSTQLIALAMTRGGPAGLGSALRSLGPGMMPSELAGHERALVALGESDLSAAARLTRALSPDAAMFRWRALAKAVLEMELAVALGLPDICSSRYRALKPYAGQMVVIGGMVAAFDPVDLYLGLASAAAGDHGAASGHFEDAVTTAERIGARASAARARAELAAIVLDTGELSAGQALLSEAADVADELGLEAVRQRVTAIRQQSTATGVFRRTGDLWTLTYGGVTAQLRDAKGLHDIAALLALPGEDVSALRLVGAEPDTGADEVLDATARDAYKARLADLDDEIDSARTNHDSARAERFQAERDALVAELANAYGLGGRVRRLGDRGERARSTVTARIHDSLRRIEHVHPTLGAHLRESLVTGRSCSYRPTSAVRWTQ